MTISSLSVLLAKLATQTWVNSEILSTCRDCITSMCGKTTGIF